MSAAQTATVTKPGTINPDIVSQVHDKDFWKSFAPEFNIEGPENTAAFELDDPQRTRKKLIREGYVHLSQPGLNTPLEATSKLFTKMVENGLPPVFAFAYDELWHVSTQLRNLVSCSLNTEYAMLPDFWAWRVAPGQAGWRPHRDKVSGSLYPDRSPKSVTVWIPITIAHPLNGCMYLLPANRDQMYGMDNQPRFSGRLPDIRALPADGGDVLLWTQNVMHWGARSAEDHDLPPRMSVAFEFQCREVAPFNTPLLNPAIIPSFEHRMALIAKQVLQYTHMYNFTEELVSIATDLKQRYEMPEAF